MEIYSRSSPCGCVTPKKNLKKFPDYSGFRPMDYWYIDGGNNPYGEWDIVLVCPYCGAQWLCSEEMTGDPDIDGRELMGN